MVDFWRKLFINQDWAFKRFMKLIIISILTIESDDNYQIEEMLYCPYAQLNIPALNIDGTKKAHMWREYKNF